jgi:hypothetical protein
VRTIQLLNEVRRAHSPPRAQVLAFLVNAENLDELTPPLRIRILTPLPIEMKERPLIEYRIGLGGAAALADEICQVAARALRRRAAAWAIPALP